MSFFMGSKIFFIFLVFSKKKENTNDNNQAAKEVNKNVTNKIERDSEVNTNKPVGFNYNTNPNVNMAEENLENISRNSNVGTSSSKAGFSFVKKAKPKIEPEILAEPFNDNLNNTQSDQNKNELSLSIHEDGSSAAKTENKPSKGGFKFIKRTNQANSESNKNDNHQANTSNLNMNEGNVNNLNINTSQAENINGFNNYNTQVTTSANKVTLDNLLNESENILNIIQKDIDNSYLSSKQNTSEIQAENTYQAENNNTYEQSSLNHLPSKQNELNDSIQNEMKENKPKKGGFNFVKKKAELPKQNPSTFEKEKETFNSENPNLNNFNDLNSDTKSFRSLKINNNIMQDNISVNLDEALDNKSLNLNVNINTNQKVSSNQSSNNVSNLKNSLALKEPAVIKETKFQENTKQSIENTIIEFDDPESLKKKFYNDVTKTEEASKDLIIQLHLLKLKNKTKVKELRCFHEKLEELALKEEEAINKNDFEEAQVIENKISDIKSEIKEINKETSDTEKAMIKLREEELVQIKNKSKILEETYNAFNKIKKSGEYELEKFRNTEVSKHKNDNIKIKKLKEKLDFLKSNLDSDKLYIDEEEAKITKLIKSQSSGVFDDLDELNQQRSEILKEIEYLKKLLEEKCAELDIVEKSIESKEIEIDAIKSNFNHEFNKIHKRKKYYEDNLKDYSDQFTQYENMVNAYNLEEAKFEEKSSKIKNDLINLEEEMKKFKLSLIILDEEFNKKEYLLNNESEIRSKKHLTEICIQNFTSTIEKNSDEINNLEVNIKRLEAENATINMRIPALEEEKKRFVSAKNFKEAGRVSNDLKTILENKTKNLTKIEENKKRILELNTDNEKAEEELIKIKEEKLINEKELNLTRYEYLITYRNNLEKMKEMIENLNFKENENFLLDEENEFLQEEITFLESLDYIVEKHSINKQSQNEVDDKILNMEREDLQFQEEGEIRNEDEKLEENKLIDNEEPKEEEQQENSSRPELNKEEIRNKIQELNLNLETCIQEENYEKADEIQQEIDILNKLLEN